MCVLCLTFLLAITRKGKCSVDLSAPVDFPSIRLSLHDESGMSFVFFFFFFFFFLFFLGIRGLVALAYLMSTHQMRNQRVEDHFENMNQVVTQMKTDVAKFGSEMKELRSVVRVKCIHSIC